MAIAAVTSGNQFELDDKVDAPCVRKSDDALDREPSRCAVGDPLTDYVKLWMSLERVHQTERLTEEGWIYLNDRMQRPIEMRILERRPQTVAGAIAALDLATYIIESLESEATQTGGGQATGPASDAIWYRRLRQHLVSSARDYLRHPGRPDRMVSENDLSERIAGDLALEPTHTHSKNP